MAVRVGPNEGSSSLTDIVGQSSFPIGVWDPQTWRIVMVNDEAADLLDSSADAIVGRSVEDFIEATKGSTAAADALESGAVEDVRARRTLKRRGGPDVRVEVWTKTVTIEEKRLAVSAFVTEADMPMLESDPTKPWSELFRTAVGFLDPLGRIQSVSTEISRILGGKADEWIGVRLVDIVEPDDVSLVEHALRAPASTRMTVHVGLHRSETRSVTAWLAVGRDQQRPDANAAFALGAHLDEPVGGERDRVADLEMRLRRIGAEVHAAGILDPVLQNRPAEHQLHTLAELSTRQWEILTRLLRGDRVPTIAADLFLSRSTVRNHLTHIFKKFGVHSQAELLAKLHSPPVDAAS